MPLSMGASTSTSNRKTVLFFSPYMEIWDHAQIEAQLAQQLPPAKYNVQHITCDGLYQDLCVAMWAHSLTEKSDQRDRQKVCESCRRHKKIFFENSRYSSQNLEKFLTPQDRAETLSEVKKLNKVNFLDWTVDGLRLGRLALYEYLLGYKIKSLDLSDEQWEALQPHLKNSLNTLKAIKKYWSIQKPDVVVMYNSLYSTNAVVREWSYLQGTKVYFLHHGMSLSHRSEYVMFGQETTLKFLNTTKQSWSQFKNQPVQASAAKLVTEHLLEVMRGRSVFAYSKSAGGADSIPQILGIPEGKKVIVAVLSSGDERLGIEVTGVWPAFKSLFPTQVEWIQFLVKWIQKHPDYHLVLRVHPREFPNKRENILSQQAIELKKILNQLPPQVTVNWPEQNLSLYDLAEYADVFLNAWSSVGKEMTQLGLPVVIYSQDLSWYPAELNYFGDTEASYEQAIARAISDGWNIENVRKAYRWMSLELVQSHLILPKLSRPLVLVRKIINKISKKWALQYDLFWIRSRSPRPQVDQILNAGLVSPLQLMSAELVSATAGGTGAASSTTTGAATGAMTGEDQILAQELLRLVSALYPEGKPRKKGGLYDKIHTSMSLKT